MPTRFNPIQQIKSLFQLPGQKKKQKESQAQLAAVQARLAEAKPAPITPLTPAVVPPASSEPVTPAAQAAPTAPAAPASDLFAKTEEIKTGLETTQEGLKTLEGKQKGEDELKKAEEELLTAQKVSPEEQEAETTLQNLLASKELGIERVRAKAIPLEFITGQQSAIERRAATLAGPLQARVSQLQGKRAAAIDVAKARGDIAKARFERSKTAEEKIDEYTNTSGKRVVVFRDKNTGKVREEVLGEVKKDQTEGERTRAIRTEVIKRAKPLFESSRGQDGFVSPSTYQKLREDYAAEVGDVKEFDDLFRGYLSPAERTRLEVSRATPKAGGGIDFESL